METEQFNLQHEVKNYLNRLHLQANLTHNDEIELENHIYDGVDSLEKKGLSIEEAFVVTIKRIGKMDILSDEYNKVNPFFVSDKLRSYSITGLGLLLSLGPVLLLIYELITLYRKNFLAQTTADMVLKSVLYVALCMAVLAIFKWGKSFSIFLQNNIEQKPLATTSLLFLLPLLVFALQPLIIGYFDPRGQNKNFSYKSYDIADVQYINLSFYLMVIAVLFITLVFFGAIMKEKKSSEKNSSLKPPILFLIIFSMVICLAATMLRFIPQSNSDLQSAVFLAVVYTIGSFSIAFYNNSHLWIKLAIFSIFGLCLGNLLAA